MDCKKKGARHRCYGAEILHLDSDLNPGSARAPKGQVVQFGFRPWAIEAWEDAKLFADRVEIGFRLTRLVDPLWGVNLHDLTLNSDYTTLDTWPCRSPLSTRMWYAEPSLGRLTVASQDQRSPALSQQCCLAVCLGQVFVLEAPSTTFVRRTSCFYSVPAFGRKTADRHVLRSGSEASLQETSARKQSATAPGSSHLLKLFSRLFQTHY